MVGQDRAVQRVRARLVHVELVPIPRLESFSAVCVTR
jgi:hypothetical protein